MGLWRESTRRQPFPLETEEPLDGSSFALGKATRALPQIPESVIAAGMTIEGKIEGAGHIRIAGRFKGDVSVEGDLTVEQGAHINGDIRASTVVLGGEVEGNVHASSRMEILASGVLLGDLKAASLSVAAGSRMQGKVEFGRTDSAADGDGSGL